MGRPEAKQGKGAGTMEAVSQGKRMVHYDLLRILAAFSVVMLHSAGQNWYTLPVTGREWQIADAWDGLFRFGVPIFVMISGAVFLEKEVDIRRLYTHNIARLLVIYFVWSGIYGLYDCRNYDLREAGWKTVVKEIATGRYHLWFLPMIVGIYMLLPILRSWVKNAEKKNIQYFLFLFFLLKILMFTLSAFRNDFAVRYLLELTGREELAMVCSYLGYFLWGYYIAHYGIGKRWHKFLYAGVIPSALLNILSDRYLSIRAGEPTGLVYDSYGLFTFVIVTALFLFFSQVMSGVPYGKRSAAVIRELSADTLGVYVMHIGLMEILAERGIDSMTVPNIVGIPLLAFGCFVLCSFFAACLRRIPLIGRYLC